MATKGSNHYSMTSRLDGTMRAANAAPDGPRPVSEFATSAVPSASMRIPCVTPYAALWRLQLRRFIPLAAFHVESFQAELHLSLAPVSILGKQGSHAFCVALQQSLRLPAYAKELDFGAWQARLKVIGADFQAARDALPSSLPPSPRWMSLKRRDSIGYSYQQRGANTHRCGRERAAGRRT